MPVKFEANFGGVSPHHCFDSDFCTDFKDFTDELSGICSDICSPHMLSEDIWNKFDDFLLTPPQSPPIKFDLVSDMLDVSSLDSLGIGDSGHSADVLHDCMWSGQCTEDATAANIHSTCSSSSIRMCAKNHSRPETPFTSSLSTSPFSMYAFDDILSTGESSSNEDMDEDSHSSVDYNVSSPSQSSRCSLLQPSKTSFNKVKESLINDHSYDSSMNRILRSKNSSNVYGTQSLIYPSNKAHTRPNPKVKCHKIKIIKANQISRSESKGEQKPQTVPTVRIIRNNQHFVVKANQNFATNKKNSNANVESEQKQCKFSTRRKASTVCSERNVMFAQNHSLKLTNVKNCEVRHSQCSDDDSIDKSAKVPPMRRREHNDSERKRRDHLRNAFLYLRDQIPKLKSAEKKPPRILILSEATAFVEHIKEKAKYLDDTKEEEMEKRDRLLKRLSELTKTDNEVIIDEDMDEY